MTGCRALVAAVAVLVVAGCSKKADESKTPDLATASPGDLDKLCKGGFKDACAEAKNRLARMSVVDLDKHCQGGFEDACAEVKARLAEMSIDDLGKLCQAKNGDACYEAGRRHADGVGVPVDRVKALEWFTLGCQPPSLDACWASAQRAGKATTKGVCAAISLETKAGTITGQQCDATKGVCPAISLDACWEFAVRTPTEGEKDRTMEMACDLGHFKSCSSFGKFKTGGILWTRSRELKGALVMQLVNVTCSVERSGHGQCEVSGYFFDGLSARRSLGVKFYDAGGALLGNDLLFYEPVGAKQIVKKTIRTVPGVTSAVIDFWQ